jgi:hypothetical protein
MKSQAHCVLLRLEATTRLMHVLTTSTLNNTTVKLSTRSPSLYSSYPINPAQYVFVLNKRPYHLAPLRLNHSPWPPASPRRMRRSLNIPVQTPKPQDRLAAATLASFTRDCGTTAESGATEPSHRADAADHRLRAAERGSWCTLLRGSS